MKNNLIDMALSSQKCDQKTLAAIMSVSPAQISKWKKGEYISENSTIRLAELAGIPTTDGIEIDYFSLMGNIELAQDWQVIYDEMISLIDSSNETGILLSESKRHERNVSMFLFMDGLNDIGFNLNLDAELVRSLASDIHACNDGLDKDDDVEDKMSKHPIAIMMLEYLRQLNTINMFNSRYVIPLVSNYESNDALHKELYCYEESFFAFGIYYAIGLSIEHYQKVLIDNNKISWNDFSNESVKSTWKYIRSEKQKFSGIVTEFRGFCIKNNIPVGADLMSIVNFDNDIVEDRIEKEVYGVSSNRFHPDAIQNDSIDRSLTSLSILTLLADKLGITDEDILNKKEEIISKML